MRFNHWIRITLAVTVLMGGIVLGSCPDATAAGTFYFQLTNGGDISTVQNADTCVYEGSTTVTARFTSGKTGIVTLSVTELPAGWQAALTPSSCQPTCQSILRVTAQPDTPSGTYQLVVTGASTRISHTTALWLMVPSP